MNAIGKRSEQVLATIISEYIATGDPVGSRTLSRKMDIGLSAASIRNIMSDLTDCGFILQPHISAGRIPTDLGYRFYVDKILEPVDLNQKEVTAIESWIASAGMDIRDALKHSSWVLADLSKQAGVVTGSPAEEQTFKTIDFIKVAKDRILVVLVSTTGFVQNKMIFDDDDMSQYTLESLSRMLNDILKDLDLGQAREKIECELSNEKARFDAMLTKALEFGHIILSDNNTAREIFIEGSTNIVDGQDFPQIEKIRAILATFEHKFQLLKLLDRTLAARGIQIFIGSEHGINEMESCSVIAYPIKAKGASLGSIGIIGPKRMNYRKLIPLVRTTANVLTRLLKRIVEKDS
ncbi:MAG: heat-inducible transcriptional repressor HrcA [Desulfomonilaceae bacterium]